MLHLHVIVYFGGNSIEFYFILFLNNVPLKLLKNYLIQLAIAFQP